MESLSSKYSSKRDTNYVPSDEEVIEIQGALSEPLSRIKGLDDNIKELKKLIKVHEKERQMLSDEIRPYQQLISPIRRLPVDLLREVFIQCLPRGHCSPMHASYPPLSLTRVCSSWRSIALSTPRLWASIHITIPNSAPPFHPSYIVPANNPVVSAHTLNIMTQRASAAKEWLEKSGACPLDISLHSWGTVEPTLGGIAIASFLSFSNRWRSLKLTWGHISSNTVADLLAADLPILESFALNGDVTISAHTAFGHTTHALLWRNSGLMKAPRLREVSFSQLREDPTTFPLKWSQLTSLTLQYVHWSLPHSLSFKTTFRMLGQCSSLIKCRLELPPPISNVEMSEELEAVCLPHLKFLAINDGSTDISPYLSTLNLPSLENFEFFGTIQWSQPNTRTSLHSILSRTSSTLRRFTTDPKFFSKEDFESYLRLCPLLKSLQLLRSKTDSIPYGLPHSTWHINDEFLKRLSNADGVEQGFCPDLEEFECRSGAGFSDAAMLEFIIHKQTQVTPGVAKLKRFAVHVNRSYDVKITELTKAFVEDGLKLDIMHLGPRLAVSVLDGLPLPTFPPFFIP